MEASLRALREDMAADRRAIGDALRAVQAELQAFRADGARVPGGDRSEAVDAVLEAKLGEFGRAMAALAGRLAAVDKLAASDNWQALGTRLEAVEGRIGAQTTELAGTRPRASRACRKRPSGIGSPPEDNKSRSRPRSGPNCSKAEEESKAREHELQEIHEAVAQLDTSQQRWPTTSRSWRAESGGDIAIVSNRLEQLEHNMLDLLDAARRRDAGPAPGEHHEDGPRRGNGFKRWLYGTRSVLAGSWRDEAASIRQRSIGRAAARSPEMARRRGPDLAWVR